jgi:hypothetical protein
MSEIVPNIITTTEAMHLLPFIDGESHYGRAVKKDLAALHLPNGTVTARLRRLTDMGMLEPTYRFRKREYLTITRLGATSLSEHVVSIDEVGQTSWFFARPIGRISVGKQPTTNTGKYFSIEQMKSRIPDAVFPLLAEVAKLRSQNLDDLLDDAQHLLPADLRTDLFKEKPEPAQIIDLTADAINATVGFSTDSDGLNIWTT